MKTEIAAAWLLPHPPAVVVRNDTIFGVTSAERVNLKRWLDPPHVRLANMRIDAASVKAFVIAYGVLISDIAQLPDGAGEQFEVKVRDVRMLQEQLQRAWRARDAKQLFFCCGAEEMDIYYMPMTWGTHSVALAPADVSTYMRLLLARDLEEKRARICKYDLCATPYFVAQRKDAEFCCHQCAVGFNVRKFRNNNKRRKQ